MSKRLNIGTTSKGKPFTLPLDLITQTVAILAKRGVGKTTTGAVISEELMDAGQRICVIDPTGAHWGLKSTADGKGAAYPVVIFGGEHADAPLEKGAGEVLARAIAEGDFSCIIDLSNFRKGETIQFLTSFFEEIYRLNRRPLHLICDEADTYAPQKPLPNQLQCLGAIEDVIKKGRIKGLGATLITLRSAIINKNVLAMCEVLVAMRAVHPTDIAPVKEWVGVHGDPETAKTLVASLPSLPVGAAWFYSPGWGDIFERVQVRPRRTFDSSATPKPGVRVRRPKVLAKVDVDRLSAEIKATIEKAKAEDPKELKKQLAAVQEDLAKEKAKSAPAVPTAKVIEKPVTEAQLQRTVKAARKGDLSALQKLVKLLGSSIERAQALKKKMDDQAFELGDYASHLGIAKTALDEAIAELQKIPALPIQIPSPAPASVPTTRQPRATPSSPAQPRVDGAPTIKAGAVKMLQELAARHPAGYTRSQVSGLTGFAPKGGTFTSYISNLRMAGFVEERDGLMFATEAGIESLGGNIPATPTSHAEVMALWRKALKAGAFQMLEEVVRCGAQGITREDLAAAVGMAVTGGTFTSYLSNLRTNGLATEVTGRITANDILFPEGR